ncbi:MAG: TonB-dependent receptor, partial [Pedobacter sp.]
FRTVTTRGFVSSGNTKLNQLVDGMDNQAPGLNFAVGSILGPTDLDVESVELLSGASSALYGSGGMNGTLLINSKDPFKYQGLSFDIKAGMNHVDKKQRSTAPYYNWSARYAKAFNNKFAFRLSAQMTQAQDWEANDYRNVARTNILSKVVGGNRQSDPNYDGVNMYGDETTANMQGVAFNVQNQTRAGILAATGNTVDIVSLLNASLPANATPAQIAGFIGALPAAIRQPVTNMIPFYFGLRNNIFPNQNVSREGYKERDLVDYNTYNVKLSGGLNYKITNNIELSWLTYFGTGTTVYTGLDRYSLRNFQYIHDIVHLRRFPTKDRLLLHLEGQTLR